MYAIILCVLYYWPANETLRSKRIDTIWYIC